MTPEPRRSWYAIAPIAEARGGLQRALLGGQVTVEPTQGAAPQVRLDGRALPAQVVDGVLYAWFDAAGGPPTFELPRLDTAGWTRATFDTLGCVGQPVSVMRDLADYPHFETVHGYFRTTRRRPFWTDGATCGLDLDFQWPIVAHRGWSTIAARFSNRCAGLGYQFGDVWSLGGRAHTRHRVLPTPIDHERMQVILGLEARLRLPLGRLFARLMHGFTRAMFRRDVADDMTLWAQLPAPEDDGDAPPLDAYWAWADGFARASDWRASP